MKLLRSLAIAFSSYSKIPIPQFEWKSDDMRYIMSFFPCIGMVIGFLEIIWFRITSQFGISEIARVIIAALIPLIITGGYHVDGFMDTSDAISSYRDMEKRLEILKDSHVGAFAVIRLITASAIMAAAVSEIRTLACVQVLALGFILSRCLSAMGVLHFKSASHKGSLFYTSSNSDRAVNTITVSIFAAASIVLMIIAAPLPGILAAVGAVLSFVYYRIMAYRKFGGITGDLAGYFVVICEVVMAVMIAIGGMICR